MNILFVCKHNKFRSKVAESYFNRMNKNKKNKAKSAGIIKEDSYEKNTVKVLSKLGIKFKGKPQPLTKSLIKWQDITIIVADNVPKSIFSNNKFRGGNPEVWKIPDAPSSRNRKIIRSTRMIIKEVDELLRRLG